MVPLLLISAPRFIKQRKQCAAFFGAFYLDLLALLYIIVLVITIEERLNRLETTIVINTYFIVGGERSNACEYQIS